MSHQEILERLLRSRGLHYPVWYQHKRPAGWMIGTPVPAIAAEYQRIGHNLFQAIDLITKGTLDFLQDAESNRACFEAKYAVPRAPVLDKQESRL